MKTWIAFVLSLGLLLALPAQAVTLQPIMSSQDNQNVTLDKPGLYDLSTAAPGATITVAVNGVGLTGESRQFGVVIGAGVTLTLKHADIQAGHAPAIMAGGMGCGLVLVGDNNVFSGAPYAGVNVPDSASLVIDGPGKLTARSGSKGSQQQGVGGAGIGGNEAQSNGPITIRNATVVAIADNLFASAAGIGGGDGGDGGDGSRIVIVNSSVTATGGPFAASIGGGAHGNGSQITIVASAVKADSSRSRFLSNAGGGAGIGSGSNGSGSDITIDATSIVQAIGQDGSGRGDASRHAGVGGSGSGAGIGGGGNDAGTNDGTTGSVNMNVVLAAGSKGGVGGGVYKGSLGGAGALCGGGGRSGTLSDPGVVVVHHNGAGGQESGGCAVDSRKNIDDALASRPDPAYAGNPQRGYSPYPPSPVFTAHPSHAQSQAGGDARFSATASGGTGALVYQWQVSNDDGSSWQPIADGGIYAGATTRTLTLTGTRQYRSVVYDAFWREAVSRAVTLTVLDPAGIPAGLSWSHGDWELACDNTRTYRAAGYSGDQDELPLSVLLTRNAGPNQPVTGQLMIGQYGEDPVLANLPDVFDVSLRINEKEVGQIKISNASRVADLTPPQVKALLAALVRTSKIKLTGDDYRWRWHLSDADAAAVLLKMDEFQGRIGTPGALVKKGKKAEASVLLPLPVPLVKAARFSLPLPGDERFVEKNSASLIEAIRSTGGEDNCPFLLEEDEGSLLSATRLTGTRMLLSANCWRGGYNSGDGYWVINATPPWRPVLVTEVGGGYAGNDISNGVISASHKGRGLGDCWSYDAWAWDGKQFVHTESSTTGMCRGIAPGGAWELPTIVSKVVR